MNRRNAVFLFLDLLNIDMILGASRCAGMRQPCGIGLFTRPSFYGIFKVTVK